MFSVLNILMAEDNRINARVAEGILTRQGHHVTVVPDGLAALDAIAAQRWDLVLMDVQMPRLCGLEATREIRRREKDTPGHVPILALTANAADGDRQRCLDAGMDGYIAKPVQADRLLEEIQAVLEGLSGCISPEASEPPRRTAG